MVRRTKEEALETRKLILRAASDVFWEKGVAGASLEHIAEQAGVTRGAIYWHFKNKCDIVSALHEGMYQIVLDMFQDELHQNHPEPLKQLEELCASLLTNLQDDPHKKKTLSIFFLRSDYAGDMEQFLKQQNERKANTCKLIAHYFERAKKEGHLPPDSNSKLLAQSLICFVNGLIYEYVRNPDWFDLPKQAPALLAPFFRGLS